MFIIYSSLSSGLVVVKVCFLRRLWTENACSATGLVPRCARASRSFTPATSTLSKTAPSSKASSWSWTSPSRATSKSTPTTASASATRRCTRTDSRSSVHSKRSRATSASRAHTRTSRTCLTSGQLIAHSLLPVCFYLLLKPALLMCWWQHCPILWLTLWPNG